ncbi:MAG: MFS transporter [Longimicrobiales bacterium]
MNEQYDARRALARFFAANVLFAAGLFVHAFLYNFYLEAVGASASLMGGAAASLTAGGLVALVPAGRLVDRRGPAAVYIAAALLTTTGLIASAYVATPAAVYGTGFLAGAGTAAWRVAMGPAIMRLTAASLRSRAFSWNVAFLVASGSAWTALAGIGPAWFEGRGLDETGGLRGALVTGALLTLVASAILPGRALSRSAAVDPASPLPRDVPVARAPRTRLPQGFAAVIVVVAVWMCAGGLVLPFFNVFFQRVHGFEIGRIGAIFGAAQLATAAALAVSAEAASRLGPRRVLLSWTLLFAPALIALGWAGSPALAVGLYLIAGFVPPATNPLIDQVLLEDAPPERQGIVSTWRNGATELSGLAGAGLGGILLDATSFRTLLAVAAVVAATGAIALMISLRRFGHPGAPKPGL